MGDRHRAFGSEMQLAAEGQPQHRPSAVARLQQDRRAQRALSILILMPVLLIVIMTFALLVRAWPVLGTRPLAETILESAWKPEDGAFGYLPFIAGTAWVTIVGMILAVGPCVLVALYLSEYAHSATRAFAKPILDLLAAIPPVVYGAWGLLAV